MKKTTTLISILLVLAILSAAWQAFSLEYTVVHYRSVPYTNTLLVSNPASPAREVSWPFMAGWAGDSVSFEDDAGRTHARLSFPLDSLVIGAYSLPIGKPWDIWNLVGGEWNHDYMQWRIDYYCLSEVQVSPRIEFAVPIDVWEGQSAHWVPDGVSISILHPWDPQNTTVSTGVFLVLFDTHKIPLLTHSWFDGMSYLSFINSANSTEKGHCDIGMTAQLWKIEPQVTTQVTTVTWPSTSLERPYAMFSLIPFIALIVLLVFTPILLRKMSSFPYNTSSKSGEKQA